MFHWLKLFVWLPVATVLYPFISAPLMIPMMLARPLHLIGVLIVTGLRLVSIELAIAFIVLESLWYSWTVFVPPRDAGGYALWAANRSPHFLGKLSQVVFLVTILALFLYLMEAFDFNSALKWFASFGIAYYVGAVAMGILNMPMAIGNEIQLRRIMRGEI